MSERSLRDALERLAEEWAGRDTPGLSATSNQEWAQGVDQGHSNAAAELLRALTDHPAEPVGVTTHLIADGEAVTSCCGRTPFELPRTERITVDRSLANCSQSVGVSDEAVEAAARALYESPPDNMSRAGYERAERDVKDIYRSEARAALEAAQPLLGTRPQPTPEACMYGKAGCDCWSSTARPLPTREQIAEAIAGGAKDWLSGHQAGIAADRVLALFTGGKE